MSDSRTVLPAPNLLNLISSEPTQTSSPSPRKPQPLQLLARCAGSAPKELTPATPGRWPTCPAKEFPLPFDCV